MGKTVDVAIVGAGMIGAAIAWRCAQRGMSVAVFDPDPTRGAWHTAAGMLAPVTETHYTETPLLRLNLSALSRYRRFVDELAEATGRPSGYRECGTLSLAWDAADHASLRDLHAFLARLGVVSQLIDPGDLHALEPALAPGISGGLLAPDDHQVDPRLLHSALLDAAGRYGAEVIAAPAELRSAPGRIVGVQLADGTPVDAATTVLAGGAWTRELAAAVGIALPVRPVKGQTLRLRLRGIEINHVVRGTVRGSPVYVVPRASGQVVVGASSEEAGFGTEPRAGAVYELLRDAQALLPDLGEAVLEQVSTGLRPATPDNAPAIGTIDGYDGLVVATGHYRNGVLLAPLTADGVVELIADGRLPDELAPFMPSRFQPAAAR